MDVLRTSMDRVLLPHPETGVGEAEGRALPAAYTWLLAVLVVVATGYGLLTREPYRDIPGLLQQTWRAQDAVTLATVPVLLWAAHRARKGSFRAHLLGVGLLAWLTYCYAHLALGTPFNDMFLVYVAVLGLAGFAMLDGLVRTDVAAVAPSFAHTPRRAAAWFLAVAGLGIAGLWLSEIVVGLAGGAMANIHVGGLPNPTWVIDLAWVIPMSLGAAFMLRRRHPAGPVVTAVLLVMLLVLSVAMLAVTPFALAAGLGGDPDVVPQLVAFTVVFAVLGAVELWLLVAGARRLRPRPHHWLRTGWWPQPH